MLESDKNYGTTTKKHTGVRKLGMLWVEGDQTAIYKTVSNVSLIEKIKHKHTLEGGKGVEYLDIWENCSQTELKTNVNDLR